MVNSIVIYTALTLNGVTYKTKAAVALKPIMDFEDPRFGQIIEVYVAGSSVYFYVQELDTEEFNEHYCVCHLSYPNI